MKHKTGATIHICDGCKAAAIQLDNADLPNGFYVQVFEVHPGGAAAGDLYVCGERCLLKAFTRRADIWNNQGITQ